MGLKVVVDRTEGNRGNCVAFKKCSESTANEAYRE